MMQSKKIHILIGATSSGCGKTTFTAGLLRCMAKRSLKVQPFKCGPDYIDTKFHAIAAKLPELSSVNLDIFMYGNEMVKKIYNEYSEIADISITEGVMGLFDGYNTHTGSSAHISQLLNIPIVLLINAKSMAFSIAPLLYGYKHYNRNINIVGVVFNMVGSKSHYNILKNAAESIGFKCYGYLPKDNNLQVPSRHLGLSLSDNYLDFDNFAERASELIESNVDVNEIIKDCSINTIEKPDNKSMNPIFEKTQAELVLNKLYNKKIQNIGIANDQSFNFIYPNTIAAFKKFANVIMFSPLKESELNDKIDFLYLPGGYPEFYLKELEANTRMKESIKKYIEDGGAAWAECGGMMYLGQNIIDKRAYKMCGVLPFNTTMENMKLKLGYRSFNYKGIDFKGHEFHYSSITENISNTTSNDSPNIDCNIKADVKIFNAMGEITNTNLFKYKNLIAGYTHIVF